MPSTGSSRGSGFGAVGGSNASDQDPRDIGGGTQRTDPAKKLSVGQETRLNMFGGALPAYKDALISKQSYKNLRAEERRRSVNIGNLSLRDELEDQGGKSTAANHFKGLLPGYNVQARQYLNPMSQRQKGSKLAPNHETWSFLDALVEVFVPGGSLLTSTAREMGIPNFEKTVYDGGFEQGEDILARDTTVNKSLFAGLGVDGPPPPENNRGEGGVLKTLVSAPVQLSTPATTPIEDDEVLRGAFTGIGAPTLRQPRFGARL